MRSLWLNLTVAGFALAQPPIPSTWRGEATGQIRGAAFRVPLTVDFSAPILYEKNPFHLSLGTGNVNSVGDVLLLSANSVNVGAPSGTSTYAGPIGVYTKRTTPHGAYQPVPGSGVTLQYLSVTRNGPEIVAVLTDTHADAAAAISGFTGPNVSAQEASDLMRGVMEALGKTEMFVFQKGAAIRMRLEAGVLRGAITGSGLSVTGTSSDVAYECRFEARRVK